MLLLCVSIESTWINEHDDDEEEEEEDEHENEDYGDITHPFAKANENSWSLSSWAVVVPLNQMMTMAASSEPHVEMPGEVRLPVHAQMHSTHIWNTRGANPSRVFSTSQTLAREDHT
jgi:hypothetical protein